ncbi:MAG: winged helix-turn-helix domain-containing protein, partial [Acetobacteraceae bacterium]|nr:winged helix-turn-helix domain-containing protein [Acetobacteraceae bacterium]
MAEADLTALCFAGFTLDMAARALVDVEGREVPLRRSEYELLRAFLAAPGRALSRDHLLDAVAGRSSEPFDRSVDVLVGRLRRKIEPEPGKPRLIVTVPGVGYRFAVRPRPASAESAMPSAPVAEAVPPLSPERRQLTILHCGLCGPALLAARRDPEDLQQLLVAFHQRVKPVITQAGGTVDRLLSDDVLAFFGYPQADEHQAERAIRAALNVIEIASPIDGGQLGRLQVRVGVATGLAVVSGESAAAGQLTVLGEAAQLAAELASRAEPNSVLISASLRHLVGELFELRASAPIVMEGAGEPVEAWQVVAEAGLESRFEALRGAAPAPLVGREEELELLLRRWAQAKAGSGRVVLISGEPGIGKSRLVRALQDAIAGQPHTELRLFGSPHHQDSALHPFIAQLERAAGFARDDTAEARLAKLDAVLARSNATDEAVALIAELLSIPTDQRERVQQMTPQARRERTLAALLAQLPGLAARYPVLMIYEDLHWIDPTSRELLDRIIDLAGHL